MKIYLKSSLPLLFINLIPLLFFSLLLEPRFLIPLIAFLLCLNVYLCFVFPSQILNHFSVQSLTPQDPWQIMPLLKKTMPPSSSVEFYKIKQSQPLSLCFGSAHKQYILFSESLLDLLSPKEKELLLSYYAYSISQGGYFALTLWSGLIYLLDRILFVLNYPLKIFKKQNSKPSLNMVMVLIFFLLTPWVRLHFFKLDSHQKENNKDWAFLLWKLDSAYQLENFNFPSFLAPLFPCNPLTNLKRGCYVSLQPKIKLRVKKLIGSYPP